MAKSRPRAKTRENPRRGKKKVSVLTQKRVEYVDYKDVDLLRRFVSDRGKIRARRVTGNDAQQQRTVANAIKNAREMALLPYANRVTTQRGAGRSERSREGAPGRRGEGAAQPAGPPPGPPGGVPADEDTGFEDAGAEDSGVEDTGVEEAGAAGTREAS